MGTLANSLFQSLLGWIRALSAQIWMTFTSPDSSTLLSWIGEHWKGLTVALCAAGLILDLVIYLFRWQPYRAWRSFFRRLRASRGGESDGEEEMPEEEVSEALLSPAVASMRMSSGPRSGFGESEPGEELPEAIPEVQPEAEAEKPEEPEEPLEKTPEEEAMAGTTAVFAQAILPRRRRRVTRLFAEGDENEIATPDQLIDQYTAYHRPVYPRSWHAEEADPEEEPGRNS